LLLLFYSAAAHANEGAQRFDPQVSAPSTARNQGLSLRAHTLQLSLTDAVALGLRDNRDIRRSYLARITDKFDLRVAEDGFSPQWIISSRHQSHRGSDDRHRDFTLSPKVSLNNEWGTRFSLSWAQRLNRADRAGQTREGGLSFELSQPLLRGSGGDVVTAPRQRVRLNERSQQLGLQAMVAQTVTAIVSAYRELLRAQEQLRIARESLLRSQQQLKVNDALIAAGRMAQVERLQSEADQAWQELSVEDAANQLQASRRALLQLLSLDLNTALSATDILAARPVDIDQQQALRIALERQPRYQQQRITEQLADIDLLLAKDQQRWDLSLVAGSSQVRQRHSSGEWSSAERRWSGYAGVQLEIPIGDLSRRRQRVAAQVAVETQALELRSARQQLEREVIDAVRSMTTHWRQYEIALRGRSLSQRSLEAEKQKLHVGRTSNFQVLSLEADLRRSESAVLNAQIAYLNAQTQLDEHLGMTLDSWEIALND
jgi:outer membrane protein TolC